MYCSPGSSVHGDSPAKNIGVGCHALLQGDGSLMGKHPLNLLSFSSFQGWFPPRQHNHQFSLLSSGSCRGLLPAPSLHYLCPYTATCWLAPWRGSQPVHFRFPVPLRWLSDLPFPCLDSKNTDNHSPWSSLLAWVPFTTPSHICNGVSPVLALVWSPSLVSVRTVFLLKYACAHGSLGSCWKAYSDSLFLRWSTRLCISIKHPSDAFAADPGTTPWVARI